MNIPDRIRVEMTNGKGGYSSTHVRDLDTGAVLNNVIQVQLEIGRYEHSATVEYYDEPGSDSAHSHLSIRRKYAQCDLAISYERPKAGQP